MATETADRAVHLTLSGTTADTVTIGRQVVHVINRDASKPLWVAWDDAGAPPTAVAEADDTEYVAPGGFVQIRTDGRGISVVGDGNAYSVVGVPS